MVCLFVLEGFHHKKRNLRGCSRVLVPAAMCREATSNSKADTISGGTGEGEGAGEEAGSGAGAGAGLPEQQ